jgi:hypothetical protein
VGGEIAAHTEQPPALTTNLRQASPRAGRNADNLVRAQRFNERVFGWSIKPTTWDGYLLISIEGLATAGLQREQY